MVYKDSGQVLKNSAFGSPSHLRVCVLFSSLRSIQGQVSFHRQASCHLVHKELIYPTVCGLCGLFHIYFNYTSILGQCIYFKSHYLQLPSMCQQKERFQFSRLWNGVQFILTSIIPSTVSHGQLRDYSGKRNAIWKHWFSFLFRSSSLKDVLEFSLRKHKNTFLNCSFWEISILGCGDGGGGGGELMLDEAASQVSDFLTFKETVAKPAAKGWPEQDSNFLASNNGRPNEGGAVRESLFSVNLRIIVYLR